ncbi:MAG: hypothetical protein K2X77_14605, partial [Candidatus Obscuribacterales bacterium]|nr:hypothetical protein [Candidatus Obscuribacterales bacterium]
SPQKSKPAGCRRSRNRTRSNSKSKPQIPSKIEAGRMPALPGSNALQNYAVPVGAGMHLPDGLTTVV